MVNVEWAVAALGYSAVGAWMLRTKQWTNNNRIPLRDVDSWVDLRAARTRGDAAVRAVPVPTARSAGGLRVVAHGSAGGQRRASAAAHRDRSRARNAARRAGARASRSTSCCCARRAPRGASKSGPKLFTELGERIHEAVLVHRDVILYANSQFASFVGVDRVESHRPPARGPGGARIRRAGRREPAPPTARARTAPNASRSRWWACRAR